MADIFFMSGLSASNQLLTRCAWASSAAFVSAYGSTYTDLGACTFTTTASLKTAVREWSSTNSAASALMMYGPILEWDVSSITDMNGLFRNLTTFNENVSSWNTSSVTDMSYMFSVRFPCPHLQPGPSFVFTCPPF